MKYSYNWLQTHIKEPLGTPEDIADTLTKHAFEVEEVLKLTNDTVLDIKVLPDRSHDALSHRGMALELSQLLNLTFTPKEYVLPAATLEAFALAVTDAKASPRFMGMLIKNIMVSDSPAWLKEYLENIGQRSINNIVDATNYVLYDLGKPMHAFDADKVVGAITTRFAKIGESITTLDAKLVVLDETILVLADDQGPLDIAGIKGGIKAEVNKDTKNIILVSSNFDSTLIRKTTQKVGIKTDAAKRFENGITSELCAPALIATAELILKSAVTSNTQISQVTDIYPNKEIWIYKVGITTDELNKVLGTNLTDNDTEKLLERRGFKYTNKTLKDILSSEVEKLLGKRYINPSNMRFDAPESFSCSSLVSYIYTLAGIPMPSISVDKYVFAEPVEESDRKLGDLVFSNTGQGRIYTETVEYRKGTPVPGGIDHVGIYMGEGKVLHASKTIACVGIENIDSAESFQGNVSYGRITKDIEQKRYVVEVPSERLDIRIKEDIIDEIGKLIGTENATASTKYDTAKKGSVSKTAYYITLIKNLLVQEGYSEVMTTSFSDKGDVTILNSVDPKKNHLRTNLQPGIAQSLLKGMYNREYLGLDTIKVFEIGNTFTDNGEQTVLALGIISKNKEIRKGVDTILVELCNKILNLFPYNEMMLQSSQLTSYIALKNEINDYSMFEVSITEIIKLITDTSNRKGFIPTNVSGKAVKYQSLSNYPFITRDVAVFVPESESVEALESIVWDKAGGLAIKIYQFDKFQKAGDTKVSYAYRIVFQAFDRTLTDVEIEPHMNSLYAELKARGWEVR